MFVSSTESAKVVLNNEVGMFTKRYIKSIGKLVGNHSILCASHHHHKLIRSRLINLFSTASISSFIQQFDQLIVATLTSWQNKSTVVVLHEALEVSFIFSSLLFSSLRYINSFSSEDILFDFLLLYVANL